MILVTKTCHDCYEKFQGNGYDYGEIYCPKCKKKREENKPKPKEESFNPFKIIGSRWEGNK